MDTMSVAMTICGHSSVFYKWCQGAGYDSDVCMCCGLSALQPGIIVWNKLKSTHIVEESLHMVSWRVNEMCLSPGRAALAKAWGVLTEQLYGWGGCDLYVLCEFFGVWLHEELLRASNHCD
jgi:hypothetical protein